METIFHLRSNRYKNLFQHGFFFRFVQNVPEAFANQNTQIVVVQILNPLHIPGALLIGLGSRMTSIKQLGQFSYLVWTPPRPQVRTPLISPPREDRPVAPPKGTEKEGKVSDTVEAYRTFRTEDDLLANEVYNYGIDMTALVKQMTYQDFNFKRCGYNIHWLRDCACPCGRFRRCHARA